MRVKGGADADSVSGGSAKQEVVFHNTPMDSSEALALTQRYQGCALVFDSCFGAEGLIPSAVHDARNHFEPCNLLLMNTPIPACELLQQLRVALGFAPSEVLMAIRVMDIYLTTDEDRRMILQTIADFAKRAPGIHFELQRWPDRLSLVPCQEEPSFDEHVVNDVVSSLGHGTANGTVWAAL